MRALLDARMIVAAAQTMRLGAEVQALVDADDAVLGCSFRSLWDIRAQLRETLPVMPLITSYLMQVRRRPWREQIDVACFIRSLAAAPPLILAIDKADQAPDDVQRQVLGLVELARKWSVLDGLTLGILLGLDGRPIRSAGLRKLLKTGVCPKHG